MELAESSALEVKISPVTPPPAAPWSCTMGPEPEVEIMVTGGFMGLFRGNIIKGIDGI